MIILESFESSRDHLASAGKQTNASTTPTKQADRECTSLSKMPL